MIQEYKLIFPPDPFGYVDRLDNYFNIHGIPERNFLKIYTQGKMVLDQVTDFISGRSESNFYDAQSWKSCGAASIVDFNTVLTAMAHSESGAISVGRPYDRRYGSCIPNVIWQPNNLPIVCKFGNATGLVDSMNAIRLLDKPNIRNVDILTVPHQLHLLRETKLGILITQKIAGRSMTEPDWNSPHWLVPLVMNEVKVWFDSYTIRNSPGTHGAGTSPVDYTSATNSIMQDSGEVVIIDADMRTLTGKSTDPTRGVSGNIASELYEELLHIGAHVSELGMTYHAHEKRLEFSKELSL